MAKHRNDLLSNEVFLGPMLDGAYDPEIFDVTTDYTDWSFIRDDDLKTIRQPVQCLGINYYSSTHVKGVTDPAECERRRNDHMQAVPAQDIVDALPPEGELTDMGWNQEPRVLTEMLVGLAKRYPGLDLMVTENGSAWKDEVTEDSSRRPGRGGGVRACRRRYTRRRSPYSTGARRPRCRSAPADSRRWG